MTTETGGDEEFAAMLQRQVCAAFGLEPWDAGLEPVPLRVRFWRAVTFSYRRGKAVDWRSYNAAEAGYLAREQAYEAALPGRAQEIADQLSGMLPDGMRFEWAAEGALMADNSDEPETFFGEVVTPPVIGKDAPVTFGEVFDAVTPPGTDKNALLAALKAAQVTGGKLPGRTAPDISGPASGVPDVVKAAFPALSPRTRFPPTRSPRPTPPTSRWARCITACCAAGYPSRRWSGSSPSCSPRWDLEAAMMTADEARIVRHDPIDIAARADEAPRVARTASSTSRCSSATTVAGHATVPSCTRSRPTARPDPQRRLRGRDRGRHDHGVPAHGAGAA